MKSERPVRRRDRLEAEFDASLRVRDRQTTDPDPHQRPEPRLYSLDPTIDVRCVSEWRMPISSLAVHGFLMISLRRIP